MRQPSFSSGERSIESEHHRLERPFPLDPVIEAYKPGIDCSLLLENLKLTPEQRILNLQALYDFSIELRHAMKGANSDSVRKTPGGASEE